MKSEYVFPAISLYLATLKRIHPVLLCHFGEGNETLGMKFFTSGSTVNTWFSDRQTTSRKFMGAEMEDTILLKTIKRVL